MLLSLFLLVFFFLLLTAAFRVELEITLDRNHLQPRIRVGLGPFFVAVPRRLLSKASAMIRRRNLKSPEELLRSLQLGLRLADSFVQSVELFHLQAVIGTGDPFWSALSCGGLWSVLGPFFSGLSASQRLKTAPQVTVQAEFEQVRLGLYLHCIFSFRLGQIIISQLKRAAFAGQART